MWGVLGQQFWDTPAARVARPRVDQIVVPECPHIPVCKEETGPHTCVVSDLFSIEEM